MSEQVTIAVDACGGDNAPEVVLEGVGEALSSDPSLEILLCGPSDVVEPFASQHERCKPVVATEVISMGEHPAEAVKLKKDSSIVVGCKLVKSKEAQGFFSAGSTGACLVSATLNIGRIKGVKRPALGIVVPAYKKPTLLLDVGANADCKLDYLLQFAQMGSAYASSVMSVDSPTVGLLNIGEEETKGSQLAQDAYRLLEEKLPNFKGNCEGNDLLRGDFDVVVTDGFTGNVCLKTIEGTASMLLRMLKDTMTSSTKAKLGAALLKKDVYALKEKLDPDAYGGSPLLGINGVCMIGHGSSGAKGVKNGILAGAREVRGHLKETISKVVASDVEAAADAAQCETSEAGAQ